MSHISCKGCKVPKEKREGYCTTTLNLSRKNLHEAKFDVIEMVQRYMRLPRKVAGKYVQPLVLGGPCPYRK